MSTFVVRFARDPARTFQGRVRHITSCEEAAFGSAAELLLFFEGMNADCEPAAVPEGPPHEELAPEGPPRPQLER